LVTVVVEEITDLVEVVVEDITDLVAVVVDISKVVALVV
jgi:hypothetical protein